MPIHPKYFVDFEENRIYHVYNRTNNKELLFLNDGHRNYFLKRYCEIVAPLVETFAWALLDNHFHLLIKVKSENVIKDFYQNLELVDVELTSSEKRFLKSEIHLSELLEFTFKRFFQSYAQSFNKDVGRKGNLFARPFKRRKVNEEKHLIQTIIYIHVNAVKHRLIKDFTKYQWSSWHSFTGSEGFIAYDFIIDFFGNKNAFIETHHSHAQKYFDYTSEMDE